jgi:hypothetical protein
MNLTEATEAIEHLTAEELDQLKSVKSNEEWNDACRRVKEARNWRYPPDWYERVIKPGLIYQVLGAGAGDIVFLTPNEEGEFKEIARLSTSEKEAKPEHSKGRWPMEEALAWAQYRLQLMEVHIKYLESFHDLFGVKGTNRSRLFTDTSIISTMAELEEAGDQLEKVVNWVYEIDSEEESTKFAGNFESIKQESDALRRRYGKFHLNALQAALPGVKGIKEELVRTTIEEFKKHLEPIDSEEPPTEG